MYEKRSNYTQLPSSPTQDLGFRVNVDATRALLELARHAQSAQPIKFIFTSSLAVFGGPLASSPLVARRSGPADVLFRDGAARRHYPQDRANSRKLIWGCQAHWRGLGERIHPSRICGWACDPSAYDCRSARYEYPTMFSCAGPG